MHLKKKTLDSLLKGLFMNCMNLLCRKLLTDFEEKMYNEFVAPFDPFVDLDLSSVPNRINLVIFAIFCIFCIV